MVCWDVALTLRQVIRNILYLHFRRMDVKYVFACRPTACDRWTKEGAVWNVFDHKQLTYEYLFYARFLQILCLHTDNKLALHLPNAEGNEIPSTVLDSNPLHYYCVTHNLSKSRNFMSFNYVLYLSTPITGEWTSLNRNRPGHRSEKHRTSHKEASFSTPDPRDSSRLQDWPLFLEFRCNDSPRKELCLWTLWEHQRMRCPRHEDHNYAGRHSFGQAYLKPKCLFKRKMPFMFVSEIFDLSLFCFALIVKIRKYVLQTFAWKSVRNYRKKHSSPTDSVNWAELRSHIGLYSEDNMNVRFVFAYLYMSMCIANVNLPFKIVLLAICIGFFVIFLVIV